MGDNMELNAKSKHDDKFKRKMTEPFSKKELETPMMRTELHEDHDSEEEENCKPVRRTRRYICDDDDDQNLVSAEGGTAPLTTQTTILKSAEVSLETAMMRTELREDHDNEEEENCKPMRRTRRYICDDDDDDQNLVSVEGGTAPLTTQTTILKSAEVSIEPPMMRTELHEYHDNEEEENCKPVKRTRRYICDDDDDQNLVSVEGVTAPLTTQTTVLESAEVSNTFVSESLKLQQYSDLPIDEPIWSGVFKIGNKYVPLAAHLSVKHCDKVWKISRSLHPRVEVTKLSRLEAWPKSFEASGPTDDSIALYFLPHEMRQDADLDKLVKEVMENDMVLQAVVGEAEMLIFPSILLPERHQTFKGKPYLWAVFKRREDKVAKPTLYEEQHGIGCRAREEEKHASLRREGHQVAGLNMRSGLEAPEEAETQVTEQEQTPSSARPKTPGPAVPALTPTMPAAMPATDGQIHPCFGAPTGALFGFIAGQTPRLEQLINEMRSEGALVDAMRGEMIGSGLGQTTAK